MRNFHFHTPAKIRTDDDLNGLCKVWQERLRLQDWMIRCEFASYQELGEEETFADCAPSIRLKEAFIRVLDPSDWHWKSRTQDVEEDLVHELLEVHFAAFKKDNGAIHIAQEQTIQVLATCFVWAYRGMILLQGNEEEEGE